MNQLRYIGLFLAAFAPTALTQGCVNFGVAAPYNALFLESYQGSSDVQGRIAVAGDAEFSSGFSVGDMLTNVQQCQEAVTVVGGSLSWPSGRNYFGNIIVGKQSPGISAGVLETGCRVDVQENVVDFAKARVELTDLSRMLASKPSTVQSQSITLSKLSLKFSGNSDIEVMNIDDPRYFMDTVKEIAPPEGIRQGALVVFNIKGSSSGIKEMEMEAFANYNVIFNFPDATLLDIRGVGVRGAVLAPGASAAGATGVVHGPVYMRSLKGPIQINLRPLPQCATGGSGGTVAGTSNIPTSTCTEETTTSTVYLPLPTVTSVIESGTVSGTNSIPTSTCTDETSTYFPPPTVIVKCRPRTMLTSTSTTVEYSSVMGTSSIPTSTATETPISTYTPDYQPTPSGSVSGTSSIMTESTSPIYTPAYQPPSGSVSGTSSIMTESTSSVYTSVYQTPSDSVSGTSSIMTESTSSVYTSVYQTPSDSVSGTSSIMTESTSSVYTPAYQPPSGSVSGTSYIVTPTPSGSVSGTSTIYSTSTTMQPSY